MADPDPDSESEIETRRVPNARHAVVYRDDSEFCAWPFNAGLWATDRDVLAGYFAHQCDYAVPGNLDHGRISTYGEFRLARSTDGGATWEPAGAIGRFPDLSEAVQYGPERTVGPLDAAAADTLLASWSAPDFWADDAQPWVAASEDGGRTWSDPAAVPLFHLERAQGRPCYLVREDGTLLLFLSGAGPTDEFLRPVVYASFDGGEHWTFLSYVTSSDDYMTICPSPVRHEGDLLAAVRCNPTSTAPWTELYASGDDGRTWSFRARVNDTGAPAHLLELADGRLLCTYGYRRPSYGVRTRVSDDGGRTWSAEYAVRADGANMDLGYPRTLQRADGRVLAVYYRNAPESDCPADGGVRHIAATAFDPPDA